MKKSARIGRKVSGGLKKTPVEFLIKIRRLLWQDERELKKIKMKYQLVLQFQKEAFTCFDDIINLEKKITEIISHDANVDGHDIRSGESNIFILTDNPEQTHDQVMPIIESVGLISSFSSAYTDIDYEEYKRIWPKDSLEPFNIK